LARTGCQYCREYVVALDAARRSYICIGCRSTYGTVK
jgi:hypothetical protein